MLIKNAMLFIDFRIYHIFIALSLVIQTEKKFDNSNLISMIVYIFKVKKETIEFIFSFYKYQR
jgi:hypothetical protein